MGNRIENMNTHFCVRNIPNTTNVLQGEEQWKRKCKCQSWMNHWRTGVLLTFPYIEPDSLLNPPCYVLGCNGLGTEGAHVLEVDGRATQYWKIVPFCKKHNNHKFTLDVSLKQEAILVAASQKNTCANNIEWNETRLTIRTLLGSRVKNIFLES